MIGQTFSHYRIIKELGRGGMGAVYLAEDTLLRRQVAIKTLIEMNGPGRQHYHARFLREAQAVSALSHRHIATIHDYGKTSEGTPYIVMEFVKGGTLADLMLTDKLTISRTVDIITEVAEGLAEAHRHGIVHRDIKPSNVGIDDRGGVKVLDFGLAKQFSVTTDDLTNRSSDLTQTREDVIIGTPGYLSPEQALGLPVDARSDIFSLGSVLYECLTGTKAFSGKSSSDVRAKVIRDDPAPPSQLNPNVSRELDCVARKALAKKTEERYQSAEKVIEELRAAGARLKDTNGGPSLTTEITDRTNKSILHDPQTVGTTHISVSGPRYSIRRLMLAVSVISLAALGLWYALRPKPYQPPAAAQRWYDIGTNDLREGAYFKAIKPLEQAVADDNKFALAHARLAEAWTELDYTDKAKDELLRVNELIPDRSRLNPIEALRLQAISNIVTRDYAKALEDYRNLVTRVPESEKADALFDLGRAYEKNDDTANAIAQYQEAIKLNPNYAAAFLRLGFVLRRSQKFDEAQTTYQKAYRLFDISNNIEGIAEVFYQRGILFSQQGKVAEANQQFQQALTKSSALENQDQRIKTLLQLSNISIVAGDAAQAAQYSQQAIELAQANGMENLTTAGLIDIGNSYFLRGNLAEAEKNFNQALRLAQSYKGKRNEARALISLASLRTHQSNPVEAGQFAEKALAFYKQGGYRKETSQAYAIVGHASDQSGKYEEALQAFENQLKLAQQVGDPQQLALCHEGLAVVLNHQENFPAALDHFEQQYSIVKALGNQLVVGYALMNRGTMLWQLGRYDEAEKSLAEALAIANDPSHEPYTELLAWIKVSQARMALSKRDLALAIKDGDAALELAGSDLKAIAVQAGATLGLARKLAGQVARGRKDCERAVQLAKTLADPLPLSHARLAFARMSLDSGDPSSALANAKELQPFFANSKQRDSELRSWLIQSFASRDLANHEQEREFARQAQKVLETIKAEWGADNYKTYLSRPDVNILLEQILNAMSR